MWVQYSHQIFVSLMTVVHTNMSVVFILEWRAEISRFWFSQSIWNSCAMLFSGGKENAYCKIYTI